jgi:hypothetical protein
MCLIQDKGRMKKNVASITNAGTITALARRKFPE